MLYGYEYSEKKKMNRKYDDEIKKTSQWANIGSTGINERSRTVGDHKRLFMICTM